MKIKFAGTGDGRGIPGVGCQCERCTVARERGGKDKRRRVAVIITNGSDTILYDTPPNIGEILNKERIFHLSAIFLSHKHFDHYGGITDFEYWPEKIPIYGNMSVLGNFEITDRLYSECNFYVLHDKESVIIGKIKVTPFAVAHKVPTFGLIFQQDDKLIVHFSEKEDPDLSDFQRKLVEKANLAIFHAVAFEGGTDHIDVKSVIEIAKQYPETRFVITHIGHNNLSHEELVKTLVPYKNLVVAYDGMELEV